MMIFNNKGFLLLSAVFSYFTLIQASPNCQDSPANWHDSDEMEYTCEDYSYQGWCEEYGDDFRNMGKTANEACCDCGGGIGGKKSDGNNGEISGGNNAWLEAHNNRRKEYHTKHGKSYVALKWSDSLAASAQAYAQELANAGRDDLPHSASAFKKYGENLSYNSGSDGPSTPNEVLTGWVEDEESDVGLHFTQVLWRATKYVGCGMASDGQEHYFVCQYIRPGNCNGNDLDTMLEDYSDCGPECPGEGCF